MMMMMITMMMMMMIIIVIIIIIIIIIIIKYDCKCFKYIFILKFFKNLHSHRQYGGIVTL